VGLRRLRHADDTDAAVSRDRAQIVTAGANAMVRVWTSSTLAGSATCCPDTERKWPSAHVA